MFLEKRKNFVSASVFVVQLIQVLKRIGMQIASNVYNFCIDKESGVIEKEEISLMHVLSVDEDQVPPPPPPPAPPLPPSLFHMDSKN